jgi:hypothetical protein
LYQINLQLPQIPSGTNQIVVSVNGTAAASALVPVQGPNGPIGGQTQPQLKGCISGPVDYITYSKGRLPSDNPTMSALGAQISARPVRLKRHFLHNLPRVWNWRWKGERQCRPATTPTE